MQRTRFLALFTKGLVAIAAAATLLPAMAADRVKFGVFPSSAALPFYIAQNRGYFRQADIEVEEIPMNSHPLTVQAIVAGSIDGAANLVTLEGANMEARRPKTLKYISLNGQNSQNVIEQFVVKSSSTAKSLKDFKGGFKLFSAPGPANIGAARAVLKKVGLFSASKEVVKENFRKYGLLDDRVVFVEGWFNKSLPTAPIDKLAIMRLDADYYDSTMDAMKNLYPKLSVGGWVILDDYGHPMGCRTAVTEFRAEHNITDPIIMADAHVGYWQRTS